MSGIARHHSEWLSLIEVSGPFLTLPVLVRVFPQGLPKVESSKLGRLRAAYEEWANAQDAKAPDASALHATWVQLVLGELLEFDDQTLRSGDSLPSGLDVPLAEHHETLRPSIAIVEPSSRAKAGTPRLLVAVWPSSQELESAVPAARWAASPVERMTQLCRSVGVRLGLVTNGERWTVVDAPVGQTAGYASWYAGLWLQEPITLAAFEALLGVRRLFAVADTDTIEALLDESVAFQQEVTDQLGYQVRRAVEVLVQALDRADLDRKRELLRDVSPARLYDAALTVMMRLVFLFCAEERGLLLLGDETYDANYAVSTLRSLLREEADRVGVEVLERRQDAWARLLATFRAVHGGVEHEALRLPALGGSLFDPDRFPFLEGRAAGTSWLATPASPLPIDNRTVLHLLEALQLLRTRGDGGTSEARKLSYRALDIEQIGHVYEGLLDHVAVRVDTDTLGLLGTKDKEPELSLDELDRERRHGKDKLIEFLKEQTGRSTSALRNDLDAELDEVAEQRLLVACGNDKALLLRVAPYHALLREDVWGYPQIYRTGSLMVTGGPERRQTGTHYTPKSLTEQIVTQTLEPLVYVGPAEGKPRDAWKLRSAAELLDLKICDMAMGSGAFLVQVCRWLAERVVEAWEEAERQGVASSADGEVLEKVEGHDLLPLDIEERLSLARRLVAERCVYGVDINPMAVELAKLSLWLVTLAKGRPFGFLDHSLRCGDSLLGVHGFDQLAELSMMPAGQGQLRLFGQSVKRAVQEAIHIRRRLRSIPIRDIRDIEAMATLDVEARSRLSIPERIADALIGIVLATNGQDALQAALGTLAIAADRAVEGNTEAMNDLRRQGTQDLAKGAPDGRPRRPFHWALEFPEVFDRKPAGFDAFVGNPPFLGGTKLDGPLGRTYRDLVVGTLAGGRVGVRGAADLCTYFLLRAYHLTRDNGCVGFITTNKISQGDSRVVGLDQIVASSGRIYRATKNLMWPGAASITVSLLHVIRGDWKAKATLDGRSVVRISARLDAEDEPLPEPVALATNANLAFEGAKMIGAGFIVSIEEAQTLIKRNARNSEVLFPYLIGKDINSTPRHEPSRWAINLFDYSLSKCVSDFPEVLSIVESRVKPERCEYQPTSAWNKFLRENWWQYFWRPEMWRVISKLDRVLVRSRVSNMHILVFAPTSWLFSDATTVFAFADMGSFAILQSSLHVAWIERQASSMRTDLRYTPSSCFQTFVLPHSRSSTAAAGASFYALREEVQAARGCSLRKLYERINDPRDSSDDIVKLRVLQTAMDVAVAEAYGWDAGILEHGFRGTPWGARFDISEDARANVVRRMCQLNAERVVGERAG